MFWEYITKVEIVEGSWFFIKQFYRAPASALQSGSSPEELMQVQYTECYPASALRYVLG